VLIGALFALTSRHSGASTIVTATIIGAVGGGVSLIVHELGHVRAAAKTPGIIPVKLSVFWLGAATHLEGAYRSGRDQLRVALAGPVASLVFAAAITACMALPVGVPLRSALFLLAFLNVAIAAFSLLPMDPLDGHKVLVGVLWSVVDSELRARQILRGVGRFTIAADLVSAGLLTLDHPIAGALVAGAAAVFLLQRHLLGLGWSRG
jgi:Zn-dependent protease